MIGVRDRWVRESGSNAGLMIARSSMWSTTGTAAEPADEIRIRAGSTYEGLFGI